MGVKGERLHSETSGDTSQLRNDKDSSNVCLSACDSWAMMFEILLTPFLPCMTAASGGGWSEGRTCTWEAYGHLEGNPWNLQVYLFFDNLGCSISVPLGLEGLKDNKMDSGQCEYISNRQMENP